MAGRGACGVSRPLEQPGHIVMVGTFSIQARSRAAKSATGIWVMSIDGTGRDHSLHPDDLLNVVGTTRNFLCRRPTGESPKLATERKGEAP